MGLLLSNPPAIIFVNADLTNSVKNKLIKQLRIDQVLDGYTFDQYVLADPNWPDNIRNIHNQRILVIRNLTELENRQYADIVAFISHGLLSTELNKFGPPLTHFPVKKIHWGQLQVLVKQKGPGEIGGCSGCRCQPKCCKCLIPIAPYGGRVRGV